MFQNLRWAPRARTPYSLAIGLVDGHPLPVDLELVGGDLLHVVICRLGRHGLELHLERVLGLKSVPHLQELTGRPGTLI